MEKATFDQVYSIVQEKKIQSEFSRIEDICYLEHAGATLYSEKQISDVFSEFSQGIFGNPHSKSTSSKYTEDLIDQIRYEVLEHFNTTPEEYSVVFTSGATSALKIIAESFQYKSGVFSYLEDNHTSVLGMREFAKRIKTIPHEEAFRIFNSTISKEYNSDTNSLFVYPAQCNFSGIKYPLHWIELIQKGILNEQFDEKSNWYVVLDAASFVSTNLLDLDKFKPDFVTISFYKIFGYPTGLGALLIKNESAKVLEKKYFGGGSVLLALSSEKLYIPRKTLQKFEDGTVNFLSICALRHGFATLKRLSLNMKQISRHVFNLSKYVHDELVLLHHFNKKPAVVLYTDTDFNNLNYQGGIINFNLLRSNGEFIGYAEVLHIANLFKIHLRTGCFCNPGACKRHLNLTNENVKKHFMAGHVCGDENDLINGIPTGSVRISFGYMSNKKDADTFLDMIQECFVEKPIRKLSRNLSSLNDKFLNNNKESSKESIRNVNERIENVSEISLNGKVEKGVLEKIFIYPIKSCGAFQVQNWELERTGLKYDRSWMIVNSSGVCVTQKTNSKLCLIQPKIVLDANSLELHFKDFQPVTISLVTLENQLFTPKCQSKVCEDRVLGWDCGNLVADWLSEVLQTSGVRLLRQIDNFNEENRISRKHKKQQLSLSNQAQFLLINNTSAEWLQKFIPHSHFHNLDELMARFRPNLVVNFKEEFIENGLKEIEINGVHFKFEDICTRCQMICIDQKTGESSVEPLKTISKVFNGKIKFGIYLSQKSFIKHSRIFVGNEVVSRL